VDKDTVGEEEDTDVVFDDEVDVDDDTMDLDVLVEDESGERRCRNSVIDLLVVFLLVSLLLFDLFSFVFINLSFSDIIVSVLVGSSRKVTIQNTAYTNAIIPGIYKRFVQLPL